MGLLVCRKPWQRASNGNVALTAQIDLNNCDGEFTLALGFDSTPAGAAHHARASCLMDLRLPERNICEAGRGGKKVHGRRWGDVKRHSIITRLAQRCCIRSSITDGHLAVMCP